MFAVMVEGYSTRYEIRWMNSDFLNLLYLSLQQTCKAEVSDGVPLSNVLVAKSIEFQDGNRDLRFEVPVKSFEDSVIPLWFFNEDESGFLSELSKDNRALTTTSQEALCMFCDGLLSRQWRGSFEEEATRPLCRSYPHTCAYLDPWLSDWSSDNAGIYTCESLQGISDLLGEGDASWHFYSFGEYPETISWASFSKVQASDFKEMGFRVSTCECDGKSEALLFVDDYFDSRITVVQIEEADFKALQEENTDTDSLMTALREYESPGVWQSFGVGASDWLYQQYFFLVCGDCGRRKAHDPDIKKALFELREEESSGELWGVLDSLLMSKIGDSNVARELIPILTSDEKEKLPNYMKAQE